MSKNKHKNTGPAEIVVESNTSVTPEGTTPVESPVVPNMSLNAADQAWVQALIEERIKNNNETEKVKREFSNFGKKLMKFLFTPAKKLDSENINVDTLSSITAFICTLTALAYCNPPGMSFAHASCDLLQLGCRAFGNYFTKTFFPPTM